MVLVLEPNMEVDHFRIVYLPNMEILESAMNKIEDFVR